MASSLIDRQAAKHCVPALKRTAIPPPIVPPSLLLPTAQAYPAASRHENEMDGDETVLSLLSPDPLASGSVTPAVVLAATKDPPQGRKSQGFEPRRPLPPSAAATQHPVGPAADDADRGAAAPTAEPLPLQPPSTDEPTGSSSGVGKADTDSKVGPENGFGDGNEDDGEVVVEGPDGDGDDDLGEEDPGAVSAAVMSPPPPYWTAAAAQTLAPTTHSLQRQQRPHARSVSSVSVESVDGGITLRDNESSAAHSDRNKACWARRVIVTDYVVVNNGAANIGAFVVWNVQVETLSVSQTFPTNTRSLCLLLIALLHCVPPCSPPSAFPTPCG